MKIKDRIKEQYLIIKEHLGHRDSRVEFLTYMDEEIYENIKSKEKINPFKDYINFLYKNNELIEEEKELYNSAGKDFINLIENTSMSKTYKMPVLLAILIENDREEKLYFVVETKGKGITLSLDELKSLKVLLNSIES